MKNITHRGAVFTSAVLAALLLTAAPALAGDAHMPAPPAMGGHMPMPVPHMPAPNVPVPHMPNMPRPQIINRAPRNFFAYQRPYFGYTMPSYQVNSGYVYNTAPKKRRKDYQTGYAPQTGYQGNYRPDYAPTIRPDAQVYNWGDDGYDPRQTSQPNITRREAGTYEGEWNGSYEGPQGQTYRGEWEGNYTGQDGRRYEGTYTGTATGAPVNTGGRTAGAPYGGSDGYDNNSGSRGSTYDSGGYDAPRGYEGYERCLRSNGVAGGAIGGVIGAIAGNRIAGRGNRTAGTLIGGGLGALAGLGIEKATKKCDRYLPREDYNDAPVSSGYPRGYPQQQPYPSQAYPSQAGGYGWQGGYYYPQQSAPITTVTVTPGTSTSTTTTTEEVVYENVYSYAPRKRAVHRYIPKRRPRCGC